MFLSLAMSISSLFSSGCLLFVLSSAGWVFGESPIISGSEKMSLEFRGELLVSELGCVACHGDEREWKGGPGLEEVAVRIQREYFINFVLNPEKMKPGTTMPSLLSALPEDERGGAASALADYLWKGEEELKLGGIEEDAVVAGKKLYHEVGCVACHNPEEDLLSNSSPLVALEAKYSVESLTAFLEDPLRSRPQGRMPDMGLDHWQARDLASYLLREQKEVAKKERVKSSLKGGEVYFKELGCAQCHEPETAASDFAKAFAKLDLTKSCSTASYSLSPEQQKQVASVKAETAPTKMTPADRIHFKMAQLNCFACHSRDELGGVTDERDEFFTTTNLNLGEQARIPPSLTGVGAKLKPAALRRILLRDGSVRPYMNTRMPRFGSENVEELVEWLGAVDYAAPLVITRSEDKRAAMKAGHELVGENNLACNSCHTFFGEKTTTLDGLDLTSMWERLQEGWFHRYLRNPQEFHPTTIMPGFWPGGKSVRPEVMGGDTDKQIDAIWQYLSKGQEARRPAGVRPEPIPYGPSGTEAVMLRRQYTGIGKRGIGVGYPSGINLSFDAGKMSLGSVWKGDFAEMSPVWRAQGSGFVKEAGEGLVRFPVGPAFARLESEDAEWPVVPEGENAPSFQFLGYALDEKQRPTFRYRFEDLEVSDRFEDFAEGPRFVRTLSFGGAVPEGVYLRAAAGEKLVLEEGSKETWKLSNGLFLTTKVPAKVYAFEEREELRLSLGGLNELVLIYHY